MPYITYTEFEGVKVQTNDYMQGMCPHCKRWEAPITLEALVTLPNQKQVSLGSTPRLSDSHVLYPRQTWKEIFKCPHCCKVFAVPFSSV